jgi:hypothetical protein
MCCWLLLSSFAISQAHKRVIISYGYFVLDNRTGATSILTTRTPKRISVYCGEPAISLHSYTVPLGHWSTRLLPVMRDPGLIPRGVLMWNGDSPVSMVSLHWWPWRDWSLWPCLKRALSQTVTRSLCRQCDNPTWSHTALLSWFHACCRSSFRLTNRHSQLLGGRPLESLQSHCIHIQFHWSSGPPVCYPLWGTRVQSSGGYLCETGILLLALLLQYASKRLDKYFRVWPFCNTKKRDTYHPLFNSN